MAFITKVKISEVNNLSDARFAAAVGFDYIGFCFDQSNPNYLAPIKAKEIMDWITGSFIVAEFGNQTLQEIIEISDLLGVDVVEIENDILPGELAAIQQSIIKKINVNNLTAEQLQKQLDAYKPYCDTFLLYTKHSILQVEVISSFIPSYQIIIGGNYNPTQAFELYKTLKPFGINIKGGLEDEPGLKDYDELNTYLQLFEA